MSKRDTSGLVRPVPRKIARFRRTWFFVFVTHGIIFAASGGLAAGVCMACGLLLSVLIPSEPADIEDHRREALRYLDTQ